MTTEEHDDSAVAAHLEYLRLRGRTASSIYGRERALIRLAAWLKARKEPGQATARPGLITPARVLLDATPADLAAWRASLTVGDDAVVAYVSHVQGFYSWAVKAGLIDASPAEGLPVPRLGRRLPRPIGEDDLMAALAAAPRRIRLMIVLAGWCGLRARELALLRRECILETVTPPVLLVEAAASKGGRSERLIPLSPFVIDELRIANLPPSGWVFRRMDGRPGPNAPWRISQLVNRHLHRHGIADTLHSLRHRCGTMAYRADNDGLAVKELLGHASLATTQGYMKVSQQSLVRAVDGLPVPGRLRKVAG